ncbi:alpha/beta hydrolase [Candidatus Methylobacter oryzae]|uniref:Carboxylesterase n=1 Tax=Candidatus Methylobacter oryzae TaxID=2497749 RepID=A0ABY3CC79_9GAMM|nr:carboxylesterase [Candidatus Methylobacter oryzae]TRW97982.1 carboxylesterase [Candidatus Methylobacter oryzae]
MNSEQLSIIEIQPDAPHKYSVIWLHGLGADGHDFESIIPELHLAAEANTHFIFPNAPIQPVTINGGVAMRSWYDILEMSLERQVDIDGISRSASQIESLIQQEIAKGIPSANILLAGFSQGGVIALHTGLKHQHKLAGIIALSTHLPTIDQLKTERSAAGNGTPIFVAHGIIDPVVAVESGKAAFNALQAMGYNIEWHDYVMEHSLCVEEIEHISVFMNSILI